jgi:hypothetical protein
VPRIQPGPWDFDLGGSILELDEENHFNRYRLITLDVEVYQAIRPFDLPRFQHYCDVHEIRCSKHGGYWSNPSSEKEFGKPGARGDLTRAGSPRWKQRAFYDFVKDLAPVTDHVSMGRIAIWDEVQVEGTPIFVGDILTGKGGVDASRSPWREALLELVESRTIG